MKNDIINTEALSSYIKGHLDVVSLLNLLIHILEQIRDWLEDGKQQCASQPFTLEDYKHLNLTDEQIRKAIVRLREDGKLEAKADWFGVHKVLIEIGIIKNDHKPYKRTKDYLKRLFPSDPTLDNLQNDLSHKCRANEELFSKDLSEWCKRPNQCGHVLEVAKQFLALLKEG